VVTLADVQAEKARRASIAASTPMQDDIVSSDAGSAQPAPNESPDDITSSVLQAVKTEKARRQQLKAQQPQPSTTTPSQTLKNAPEDQGVFSRAGEGFLRGAKTRATGITQAIVDALPDSIVSPETRQKMQQLADQSIKENEGTGVAGTIGEIAGDPLTYLPIPGSGIVKLAGKGAAIGGISGATSPVQEGGSWLENTLKGTAMGGTLGATTPVVTKAVGAVPKIPGAVGDILNKITGSLTEGGAQNRAEKYVAKKLAEEGVSPTQLEAASGTAERTGLGAMLPEYTNSNTLQSDLKNITKGKGKAAQKLKGYIDKRAETTIPETITEFANPIANKRGEASKLYDKFLPENHLSEEAFSQISDDPVIQDALKKLRKDSAYQKDIGDLPDNNYKVLQRVKEVLEDKANSLEGSDKNTKAYLVRQSSKKLVELMDNEQPEYANIRRIYERGSAGKSILDALQTSKAGSLKGFKNKLYGTPEKADKLKESLNPEEYRGFTNLVNSLDDIIKADIKGSDTASNIASQQALKSETGAPILEAVGQPVNALEKFAKWYSDKTRQKDYEAIARVFTDPDIEKLGKRLRGLNRQNPKAKAALDEFATKALSVYAGKEAAQENNDSTR
jgi:hypothetical protein